MKPVTDEEIAANADRWGKQLHESVMKQAPGVGFFFCVFRLEGAADPMKGVGMSWAAGPDKVAGRQRIARLLQSIRDRLLNNEVVSMGSGIIRP